MLDLRIVAACGVDMDPEISSYTQSLVDTGVAASFGGMGGVLWWGIALFEPRLHGAPHAANKVLAARLTKVRTRGVDSSAEAKTCAGLPGCSFQ